MATAAAPSRFRRVSVAVSLRAGASLARQFLLEKTGQAAITEEDQEFRDLLAKFQTNKIELTEATAKADAFFKAEVAIADLEIQFNSSLAKLGSHSKGDSESAAVVQSFIPCSLKVQSYRRTFASQFKEFLLEPLQSLSAHEIVQADILLRAYESCRLAFAARTRELANLASKPDDNQDKINAQTTLEAAEAKYVKCKKDLADVCGVIESRKSAVLHTKLPEYVEALKNYHDASSASFQDLNSTASS